MGIPGGVSVSGRGNSQCKSPVAQVLEQLESRELRDTKDESPAVQGW